MAQPADFAPYIRAALASLQVVGAHGLAAKIATYNANVANVYDLDPVVAEAFYFGGNDAHYVFPAVEVAVPEGALGRFSLSKADAEQSLSIAVTVWLEGATGEIPELHEKVLGYGLCVSQSLLHDDAFGPGVEVSEVRSLYPMIPTGSVNPETRSFDRWKTLAAMEFMLHDVARRDLD